MKKKIVFNGEDIEVEIKNRDAHHIVFEINGKEYAFTHKGGEKNHCIIEKEGKHRQVFFAPSSKIPGLLYLSEKGMACELEVPTQGRVKTKGNEQGHMLSPMPGKIIKVFKKAGDRVETGEAILVMEAMKMEHTIKANCDGVIEKIHYKEGELVDGQMELVEIKE